MIVKLPNSARIDFAKVAYYEEVLEGQTWVTFDGGGRAELRMTVLEFELAAAAQGAFKFNDPLAASTFPDPEDVRRQMREEIETRVATRQAP